LEILISISILISKPHRSVEYLHVPVSTTSGLDFRRGYDVVEWKLKEERIQFQTVEVSRYARATVLGGERARCCRGWSMRTITPPG
jgi:hypothetical protein